jgi:HlyD family secretion protein
VVRRWTRRLLVPAGLILIILALRLTVFRAAPVPVTVYRVQEGRVEDTVVNSRAGTIDSRHRAQMSPGVAGLVLEIPVRKGEAVKRGQVLLRLDAGEYQAQVTLASRSYDAAKAAADEAELLADQATRGRNRAEALAGQALLSDQALEEANTQAQTAQASSQAARERVKQAAAALASAQATLEKTTMVAPFAGMVLDVTTEVGEWISPSPPGVFIPPVVDLIDPDSLYVSAPLDEADVARVRRGLPVRITIDAFRGRSFPGVISYVSSYVETRQEQNRTLTVEADFTERNLPPNILAGLSADVEVILDSRENVLRIPTYALLEGQRVLVARDRKLVSAEVKTGLRNWEFTEITSGLSAGDLVAVSLDRPEVKAGARVSVTAEVPR